MTLNNFVLAENITVKPYYLEWNRYDFDFLCPNCGQRHWGVEICRRRFNTTGYALKCGRVMIRMPWADETPRDPKTVYAP